MMHFAQFSLRHLLASIAVVALIAVPEVLAGPPPGKGGGGGKINASLSVEVIPATFTERDAGAIGIVTRANSDTTVALTVMLASSDETEATVPENVVIPIDATSVDFDITAVDDTETDGDQQVTISVSATDHSEASASITVVDDEGLPNVEYQSVSISLPFNPSGDFVLLNDFNDSGQACGRYGDPRSGWIYSPVIANHPSDVAVDVNSLDIEGLDSGWVIRNCVGISNNGLVVGYVSPVDDDSSTAWRGYVLDISVSPAQFYELPDDGYGWQSTYSRKVNDNGDILGSFTRSDGSTGAYFFNPGLRSGAPDMEVEVLDSIVGRSLNNPPEGFAPTIAGQTTVSDTRRVVVYTRGSTPYLLPEAIGVEPALNDLGGVAGRGSTVEQINKKKFVATQVVYRDYVTEEYLEGYYGIVYSLNNAETIMIRGSQNITLYHDDYGFIDVASITAQGEFPVWTSSAWMNSYNDGPDGFGQIAVLGGSDAEFQILTPVDLTP